MPRWTVCVQLDGESVIRSDILRDFQSHSEPPNSEAGIVEEIIRAAAEASVRCGNGACTGELATDPVATILPTASSATTILARETFVAARTTVGVVLEVCAYPTRAAN